MFISTRFENKKIEFFIYANHLPANIKFPLYLITIIYDRLRTPLNDSKNINIPFHVHLLPITMTKMSKDLWV